MPFLPALQWLEGAGHARIIARIGQRRRPERRLLGAVAVAAQHDDLDLIDAATAEALAWPEASEEQCTRKAALLFAMTALLARARRADLARRLAPQIPFAPGMSQVLVFSTSRPQQCFCWRVTPAYALIQGRRPTYFPIEPLVQPYQRGQVSIDHTYLQRVLLPRRRTPRPILLLPHPLGLVDLDGTAHIILDGNHRVVCAWRHRRCRVPAFVLNSQEATAVLISHSQWPPYAAIRSMSALQAGAIEGADEPEPAGQV
jgi:hypothetical protein